VSNGGDGKSVCYTAQPNSEDTGMRAGREAGVAEWIDTAAIGPGVLRHGGCFIDCHTKVLCPTSPACGFLMRREPGAGIRCTTTPRVSLWYAAAPARVGGGLRAMARRYPHDAQSLGWRRTP